MTRTWVDHLAGQAGIAGGQRGVGPGQPADGGARSGGHCSERGELRGRGRGPRKADVVDVALLRVAGVAEVVALRGKQQRTSA